MAFKWPRQTPPPPLPPENSVAGARGFHAQPTQGRLAPRRHAQSQQPRASRASTLRSSSASTAPSCRPSRRSRFSESEHIAKRIVHDENELKGAHQKRICRQGFEPSPCPHSELVVVRLIWCYEGLHVARGPSFPSSREPNFRLDIQTGLSLQSANPPPAQRGSC
jgi:hypothetical protein